MKELEAVDMKRNINLIIKVSLYFCHFDFFEKQPSLTRAVELELSPLEAFFMIG